MTQYVVLLYAVDDGANATPEERDAHHRHADELTRSGTMRGALALERDAVRSVRGGVVTDGPFIEAKEMLAGLYVIEAPDLDAAVEIARRNPINEQGGGVEVRPVEDGTLD